MATRMTIELRHLRSFVAVAEELHFGRAAARLGLTQPPLSQQISQLERELGVQLLLRTNRWVELTHAGRGFLADAERTLAQFDRAVRGAMRSSEGQVGMLAVGFVTSASHPVIARSVRSFCEENLDVDVELRALPRGPLLLALMDSMTDVAFAHPPFTGRGLASALVAEEPLVVVLPAGHRLARSRRVDVRSLADEPFVVFDRRGDPGLYDAILDACRNHGFLPQAIHDGTDLSGVLTLVAAGLGVSLVPATLVRGETDGSITARPLKLPEPAVGLHAVWRDQDASPLVARFVAMAQAIADEPGGGAVRHR